MRVRIPGKHKEDGDVELQLPPFRNLPLSPPFCLYVCFELFSFEYSKTQSPNNSADKASPWCGEDALCVGALSALKAAAGGRGF